MDKKAKKVGQVKEKMEEEVSTEGDSEDTNSSLSSDTSIFHIREKKEGESNSVKAIFELKDEGLHYILNLRAKNIRVFTGYRIAHLHNTAVISRYVESKKISVRANQEKLCGCQQQSGQNFSLLPSQNKPVIENRKVDVVGSKRN